MSPVRSMMAALSMTGLLCCGSVAATDIKPSELIGDMSHALQTLNYEGTFVHVQNGVLDSMHILHSSDRRGELERMLSLNGDAREIIRNHSRVTCIWPASSSVVVTQSKARRALPDVDASLADNQRYLLRLESPDRVAGRATHVVSVVPRDQYRYGYRFWIDEETKMLLRSESLDGNNKPLDQVMFTTISYPDLIDPQRFDLQMEEIDSDKELHVWKEDTDGKPLLRNTSVKSSNDRVKFVDLPQGYKETSKTYRAMPIHSGPISHVMLTDGMASVSVYVEHIEDTRQDKSTLGLSSMGAMNAFGLSLPEGYVTVVGEVPGDTVREIAISVRLTD